MVVRCVAVVIVAALGGAGGCAAACGLCEPRLASLDVRRAAVSFTYQGDHLRQAKLDRSGEHATWRFSWGPSGLERIEVDELYEDVEPGSDDVNLYRADVVREQGRILALELSGVGDTTTARFRYDDAERLARVTFDDGREQRFSYRDDVLVGIHGTRTTDGVSQSEAYAIHRADDEVELVFTDWTGADHSATWTLEDGRVTSISRPLYVAAREPTALGYDERDRLSRIDGDVELHYDDGAACDLDATPALDEGAALVEGLLLDLRGQVRKTVDVETQMLKLAGFPLW